MDPSLVDDNNVVIVAPKRCVLLILVNQTFSGLLSERNKYQKEKDGCAIVKSMGFQCPCARGGNFFRSVYKMCCK